MLSDFGVEDLAIFYHSSLQRLITGIRRRRGEEDNRERLPITKDFLLQLVSQLDLTVESQAVIRAAYCLTFATFLRAGKFTCLNKDFQNPEFAS